MENNFKRIYQRKSWNIQSIANEFKKGFNFLAKYDKAVTIFGSARVDMEDILYKQAEKLAGELCKMRFAVITGGGPGIMEAANKGAHKAGGHSAGINIKGIHGFEKRNPYVSHAREAVGFYYFFVRKAMLSFASELYIFFPGGFGTLDEFFEMTMLIQTRKIAPVPIILIHKEYWQPLLDWLENSVYKKHRAVGKEDLKIYNLVDNVDEALELIKKLCKNHPILSQYEAK